MQSKVLLRNLRKLTEHKVDSRIHYFWNPLKQNKNINDRFASRFAIIGFPCFSGLGVFSLEEQGYSQKRPTFMRIRLIDPKITQVFHPWSLIVK